MATPKRDRKGRFVKRTAATNPKRRRKAPRRRAVARARSRRTYTRNPKAPDILTMLLDGSIAASQVLVGKALARALPTMANLPKAGNVGLAVQAAVALAAGYVASMFLSRGAAAAIMAGGLTAPIETLIVANRIPFLSEALSPGSTQAAVIGYAGMGRYSHAGIGRYSHAGNGYPALAGYPDTNLGYVAQDDEHDDYGAF